MKSICKFIDRTHQNLHIQVFCFNHPTIIQHLVKAAAREVRVSVQYRDGTELEEACKDSTICLQKQSGRSLFHKKSMVGDSQRVLASSGNFTPDSTEQDINLSLLINDSELARHIETNQFVTRQIGNQFLVYIPIFRRNKDFRLAVRTIKKCIAQAKKTIVVVVYILTHPVILKSLQAAAARGVKVEVAVDTRESEQTQRTLERLQLSLPLRVRKPGAPRVHVKMCYIDNKILICGSANWSSAGLTRNREDLFVIRGLTETQRQSLSEIWQSVEEKTEPLTAQSLKRPREEEDDPGEGTSSGISSAGASAKKAKTQ
ncbi:phospholipase [Chlamydia muridarum str. Nigg]|nr:phospholipase [Chlamydia muridarum str. Nigg]